MKTAKPQDLKAGMVPAEQFDLLLAGTSIRSEPLIAALREHLVEGVMAKYARGRSVEAVVAPQGNAWLGSTERLPESVLAAPWSAEWLAFQHVPNLDAERSALYSIARRAQAATT